MPNDDDNHDIDNQDSSSSDTDDRVPEQAPTTTRARREIKAHRDAAKNAMEELQRLKAGKPVSLSDLAIDCLVCVATDQRYPLDEQEVWVAGWRQKVRDKQYDRYLVELALDELDDVHTTYEAALAALKVISLLDARLGDTWGNLEVIELARKINFLGHELLRGRIAGVAL